jgi:arylsulfatase A-like enzyme
VTSDHGETFLERGPYISHSYMFVDEEIRVPLIVRLPGGAPRGRSERLVDSTDVAAMVLDLVRGGSAFTGGLYARTRDWKVMTAVRDQGAWEWRGRAS